MTVNYYLDNPSKAAQSESETSIYVFVGQSSHRVKVNSGMRIHPKYWDDKKQLAKRSYPEVTELNMYLTRLRSCLLKAILESSTLDPADARNNLKSIVLNQVKGTSSLAVKDEFKEVFKQYLDVKRPVLAVTSMKKNVTTYNHLLGFSSKYGVKLNLTKIDYQFMNMFVNYLITDLSQLNNSVRKQITILKAFLNWARDSGIQVSDSYLKFKWKESPTEVHYLNEEELLSIFNIDLTSNLRLDKVRDLFCFQAFTGQRYSDVAAFRWDQINLEKMIWSITTQKTHERLDIPLSGFALKILLKYKNTDFPHYSNQKLNNYLKELGEYAGINSNVSVVHYSGSTRIEKQHPKYKLITTHVARKTFVTLSLQKGMRPEVVMKVTGHKDFKTLKKYLKITDDVKHHEMLQVWSFK